MTIRDETLKTAIERLYSCNTVINCLQTYGDMNAKNKILYEKAVALGLKIISHSDELV